MERIKKLMAHPLYVSNQRKIEELEEKRKFCRHGISHSLDVARILYIKVLEEQISVKKDVVYGVALLHDIGRALEYESGVVHHEAGVKLAEQILSDCDYTKDECEVMIHAIGAHKEKNDDADVLCKLLYEADKLSRNCYDCKVWEECYWPEDKKNHYINY
ncbi:MAG: HD domain-containing protein [Lachnospiraceae bacterium]